MSRTSDLFLEKLFEQEIPEIADGIITIHKVVRIPGEKAKVAVDSYNENIDAVGACVGVKGSRIHGIVRELDRKSTRLNSSHVKISYAVFCLKKKTKHR